MKRVMLTRPDRSTSTTAYVRGVPLLKPASIGVSSKGLGVKPTTPHPTPIGGWGGGGDSPIKEEEKNQVSLSSVLDLVDKLPASERKTLLARLALTSQTQENKQSRDQDLWAQAVYEALQRALGSGDGAAQGPAMIRRVLGASSAWAPVSDFMTSSRLQNLSVTERYSVYTLLARLVVDYAHKLANRIGAPLGAKLVGTCAVNVSSLFDNAFPGYVQSGLAHIVARQLAAGQTQ